MSSFAPVRSSDHITDVVGKNRVISKTVLVEDTLDVVHQVLDKVGFEGSKVGREVARAGGAKRADKGRALRDRSVFDKVGQGEEFMLDGLKRRARDDFESIRARINESTLLVLGILFYFDEGIYLCAF